MFEIIAVSDRTTAVEYCAASIPKKHFLSLLSFKKLNGRIGRVDADLPHAVRVYAAEEMLLPF